jgi:uncharacterized iron-regulated protein
VKKNSFSLIICCLLVFFHASTGLSHPHILVLESGREISFSELIADLENARAIFMGELHDHPGHHLAQLAVIQALHQEGREVAIALEMFQRDDQEALDQWVSGSLSQEELLAVFQRNWQWWDLYLPIFETARDNGIEMLALNIQREITAQVAREGFDSLSPEQIQEIGFVSCRIDPAYEQFIRRTMGAVHGHHEFDFQHFCEAQLVWDTAMAQRLQQYLDENPRKTVVVLAGSGHAWRYGIPAQLDLGTGEYAVVLPEIAGKSERVDASPEDADFLWLDTGPDGWQP